MAAKRAILLCSQNGGACVRVSVCLCMCLCPHIPACMPVYIAEHEQLRFQ